MLSVVFIKPAFPFSCRYSSAQVFGERSFLYAVILLVAVMGGGVVAVTAIVPVRPVIAIASVLAVFAVAVVVAVFPLRHVHAVEDT